MGYASLPNDPSTWKEIDFTYKVLIRGKPYINTIAFLRPVVWLTTHHIKETGNRIFLSIPEFNLFHICAVITAIKPSTFTTPSHQSIKISAPIIGKFKRYVTDIRTYRFKDNLGHTSYIHATPNHPFYVKNKLKFIPITEVTDADQLMAITHGHNKPVQLVCYNGKHTHCGMRSSTKLKRPIAVYNLEVYRKHIYGVGPYGVLVHNVYTCTRPRCFAEFHTDEILQLHIKAIHQSHQPLARLNLDYETEFTCPACRETFSKSKMDIHIKSAHIPPNSQVCDSPDCYVFFSGRNKIKLLQAHKATHEAVPMEPTDLPATP